VLVSDFDFRASCFIEAKMQSCTRTIIALAACWAFATAQANDPQINTLAPYGVQRGSEVTFTVGGVGLATGAELMFYTPVD
jgi:hypothetical protein